MRLDLGAGRVVTIWENEKDRVLYDAPIDHAFSLYLKGGAGTRRLDTDGKGGWPGSVCVMPAGHRSDWEITTPFRFVHFDLPDDTLRAAYVRTFDLDARQLDLREITQEEEPALARPLAQMARAAETSDILLAESAVTDLVSCLPNRTIILKGGLTSSQLRRTDEWIAANLGNSIRLADLAAEAGLSEFHFHRMFGLTRGTSPHKWVTMRRVEAAKAMLHGDERIADIATTCGFACQSHMTRAFKVETGTTPARYRTALQN